MHPNAFFACFIVANNFHRIHRICWIYGVVITTCGDATLLHSTVTSASIVIISLVVYIVVWAVDVVIPCVFLHISVPLVMF